MFHVKQKGENKTMSEKEISKKIDFINKHKIEVNNEELMKITNEIIDLYNKQVKEIEELKKYDYRNIKLKKLKVNDGDWEEVEKIFYYGYTIYKEKQLEEDTNE